VAVINYPGLFEEPITLNLAAWANTQISVVNDVLDFGAIELEEVLLSSQGIPLSTQARATLQSVFQQILQSVFDTALNQALPSIPIPSFELPSSLNAYGIPSGTRLGARSLSLSRSNDHLVVEGIFRP
jgi:hypothetical protein